MQTICNCIICRGTMKKEHDDYTSPVCEECRFKLFFSSVINRISLEPIHAPFNVITLMMALQLNPKEIKWIDQIMENNKCLKQSEEEKN